MKTEEQKSEFIKAVETFATDCSNNGDEKKVGLVIIGVEEKEEGTHAVIGVVGRQGLIVEGLAQFFGRIESMELVKEGLKTAARNKLGSLLSDVKEANEKSQEEDANA